MRPLLCSRRYQCCRRLECHDSALVKWVFSFQLVGAGPDAPEAAVVHAPLSVLPAPFPEGSFRKACDAAPAFNALIAAVAADSEYLQRTLAPAAEYDDFTVRSCYQCGHETALGSDPCFSAHWRPPPIMTPSQ